MRWSRAPVTADRRIALPVFPAIAGSWRKTWTMPQILPRSSSRAAPGIVRPGRRRAPIHSVDRGSHRVSEGGLEPRRGVRRPADSSVDLRERYLQLRPITPSFGALFVQNVSTELRSGDDSTGK